MKKSRLLLSIGLLAFAGASTTLTSCGDEEVCPVGYEGKDCKDLSRAKFIGSWKGKEDCTVSTSLDEYTVAITASGSSEIQVVLGNIYNESFTGTGTMTAENKFTFSGSESGTTFNGTGTLNAAGDVVLDYSISNGSVSNSCVFTGSKL